MEPDTTYLFENGKVYTLQGGRVVAAVKESEFMGVPHEIHERVQLPDAAAEDACPECGGPVDPTSGACPNCGYGEQHLHHGAAVTTPNGLKGTILGKVAGLWGDEVTVRFENGRIVKLPVAQANLKVEAAAQITSMREVIEGLKTKLANGDDIPSRQAILGEIQIVGRRYMAAKIADTQARELHEIIVQAQVELNELKEAASLETEAYEPPAPFKLGHEVFEQASMGRHDGTWLDDTINKMAAEAEATDYERLMDEGPEAFIAELDDAPLADAGVVRTMASRFIRSHTAAADESLRDKYENVWLARVEECRRSEVVNRKQDTHKEAANQQDEFENLPDDVLFGS